MRLHCLYNYYYRFLLGSYSPKVAWWIVVSEWTFGAWYCGISLVTRQRSVYLWELFFMSALFVVYLESLSWSHIHCWDEFFVRTGTSIWAGKSIIDFLPFVQNPTPGWGYSNNNWIFIIIFCTRIFAVHSHPLYSSRPFIMLFWTSKTQQRHYYTASEYFHYKWHSTMRIQSKY